MPTPPEVWVGVFFDDPTPTIPMITPMIMSAIQVAIIQAVTWIYHGVARKLRHGPGISRGLPAGGLAVSGGFGSDCTDVRSEGSDDAIEPGSGRWSDIFPLLSVHAGLTPGTMGGYHPARVTKG